MITYVLVLIGGFFIGQIVGAVAIVQQYEDDVDGCEKLLLRARQRRALRNLAKTLQSYGKKEGGGNP
jgi:hypothetical protein